MKKRVLNFKLIAIAIMSLCVFSCQEENIVNMDDKIVKQEKNREIYKDDFVYKVGEINPEGQVDFYFSMDEIKSNFEEDNPGYEFLMIDIVPNSEDAKKFDWVIWARLIETDGIETVAFFDALRIIEEDNIIYYASKPILFSKIKCRRAGGCENGCKPPKLVGQTVVCEGCLYVETYGTCKVLWPTLASTLEIGDLPSVIEFNPILY